MANLANRLSGKNRRHSGIVCRVSFWCFSVTGKAWVWITPLSPSSPKQIPKFLWPSWVTTKANHKIFFILHLKLTSMLLQHQGGLQKIRFTIHTGHYLDLKEVWILQTPHPPAKSLDPVEIQILRIHLLRNVPVLKMEIQILHKNLLWHERGWIHPRKSNIRHQQCYSNGIVTIWFNIQNLTYNWLKLPIL